ncbi:hypothetical protein STEG23_012264 [Scotinomys teguina]
MFWTTSPPMPFAIASVELDFIFQDAFLYTISTFWTSFPRRTFAIALAYSGLHFPECHSLQDPHDLYFISRCLSLQYQYITDFIFQDAFLYTISTFWTSFPRRTSAIALAYSGLHFPGCRSLQDPHDLDFISGCLSLQYQYIMDFISQDAFLYNRYISDFISQEAFLHCITTGFIVSPRSIPGGSSACSAHTIVLCTS